jgi:hypothetical protein
MKKIHKSILAVVTLSLMVSFIISCSKKDTTENPIVDPPASGCPCSTTPTAVAANNTSSKGIYVGVVIGSTGTIKFDVANGGATVTGSLVIDGVTIKLTTTSVPIAGAAFSATFTGTLNGGAVSVKFSVDADGKNPTISLPIIPGHAGAQFLIAKETSTSLIEAYVGTYSNNKPESGTFNMIVNRTDKVWSVIARVNGSIEVHLETGTIVGDKLVDTDKKTIATLSKNAAGVDVLNGTFSGGNNNTEITTVSGTRAL